MRGGLGSPRGRGGTGGGAADAGRSRDPYRGPRQRAPRERTTAAGTGPCLARTHPGRCGAGLGRRPDGPGPDVQSGDRGGQPDRAADADRVR